MKGLGLEAEKAERLVRQHGVRPPAGAPERVPALAEVFWELVRPPLEAFAQELDRLVAFWGAHFRGAVIERVLLGGGGAALAGLEAYLQQRLGLPVGVVDPCAGLTLHETPPEESRPALAVATGLALRGGATRA
ncbi:MAG: hypothetical protein KatS3mg131_0118 [Candidatus Tectimicrobiota bacterium]|nr:MAG: hypothetical protein KatS3mg131_0118 [Candidatus Tectomicrobia bacterium]